jgi:hypothetical protein
MRWISLSCVFAGVLFGSLAYAAEKPVCALLDVGGLPVVPVLEAILLEQPTATWVERTQVERVLREQELQAAFSPDGVGRRAALGQLLKADVLVLLRSQKNPEPGGEDLIDCVVCDTRQGLRLRTVSVASDSDLDAVAAKLEEAVRQALVKRTEKLEAIIAVPPFLSEDLDFQNNHLQAAYAKLVEQVMLEQAGVVVVELGEAQAIARELAFDKQGAGLEKRQLPLYVMGRYRHDGLGKEQRLRMSLRLMRGDEQITLKGARDLLPSEAPTWILTKAAELTAHLHSQQAAPKIDPQAEGKQLAARALDFQRVGNWAESYSLYEASLLLHDDEDAHRQAVVVAGKYAWKVLPTGGDVQRAQQGMAIYERGLEHLERFLRTADDISKYQFKDGSNFALEFDGLLYPTINHPDHKVEIKDLARGVRHRRTETYLRIARMRREAKRQDRTDTAAWETRAVWLAPQDEQFATVLRFAREWKDDPILEQRLLNMIHRGYVAPEDTPALRAFLEELARLPQGANVAGRVQASVEARAKEIVAEAERQGPLRKPPDPRLTTLKFNLPPAMPGIPRSLHEARTINGAVRLGNGVDLFWAGAIYVMEKPGDLRVLYSFDGEKWLSKIVFDGKYVWLAVHNKAYTAELLAIDPDSGAIVRFTADDGLPFVAQDPKRDVMNLLQIAAVAPGHVCAAGFMGRTWIANVHLSPTGKKRTEIFHEAREAENSGDVAQEGSTEVAFKMGFMIDLHGPGEKECRIVLGRNNSHAVVRNRPLVIDPFARTVTVGDYLLPGDMQSSLISANRDAIYLLRQNRPRGPKMMRIAYPAEKMELFAEDVPDGHVLATPKDVQIIGKQWWIGDFKTRTFTKKVNDVAWFHPNMFDSPSGDGKDDRGFKPGRDGDRIREVTLTNRYGPIVRTEVGFVFDWYYFEPAAATARE